MWHIVRSCDTLTCLWRTTVVGSLLWHMTMIFDTNVTYVTSMTPMTSVTLWHNVTGLFPAKFQIGAFATTKFQISGNVAVYSKWFHKENKSNWIWNAHENIHYWFDYRGVSAEKEGPPLPFRLKPYKVKKLAENGKKKSANIVQYRKNVTKRAQNKMST
jgi:hypothetical protein